MIHAVKIENLNTEDIEKLEMLYSVDIYKGNAYVQYPTLSSAIKGAARIMKRFGLAGEVVDVQTKHEQIVAEID